jgi:hypothetical protein
MDSKIEAGLTLDYETRSPEHRAVYTQVQNGVTLARRAYSARGRGIREPDGT